MYDNISLYLDSSEVNDINLLNEVLENGDDITIEQTGISGNGMPYAYISLEGKNNQKLTFKLLPYRIAMMGKNSSICKFYLGNNFDTLSLEDFNNAINEISERLGVNIQNAKVCRIDIAQNFHMVYTPSTYHNCLLHLSRYKRGDINGNLYFKTSRIELNFYDKKKEYREKGVKIPDKYIDSENVLRYEIRFKKNIAKIFGRTIKIKDLCSESFFKEAYDKWQNSYWNITKQNPVLFQCETSTFRTKDFKDYYLVKGIESTGGMEYAYKMIDESKKAKAITKHNAIYLKTVLNNAFNNTNNTANYDFTGELNTRMKSTVMPLR